MKNLFLTGPMGCGKSTAIASALGPYLPGAGGFLTIREKDDGGRAVAFWLKRPDGSSGQVIIDCAAGAGTIYPEVFETLGIRLLEEAKQCKYVILDELGGFEVLSESFMAALMELLDSDTPCIGVMKGQTPAGAMIRKLGLGDAYIQKAEKLRQWLQQDGDTLLYECGRFDPEAFLLAQQWVAEYINKSID